MKQRDLVPTGALLLLIALVAAAPLAAQPSPEGMVIRRIVMEAPEGTDAGRLRAAIHTREGDLYDRAGIQADIATLYAMGEFSAINADAAIVDGKVEVTFRAAARPRIVAVEFAGDLGESRSTLEGLIRAKAGAVANPYDIKTDQRVLEDHYKDAGYLFADVRQEMKQVEGGENVLWTIQAGPNVKLESIQFRGNEDIPEDELRKTMLYSQEGGFGQGRFDWEFLRSDLLGVRELARRKGYLDATVGHKLLFDDSKERAHLVVEMELGPLYRVSALTLRISGAAPGAVPDAASQVIPASELLAAMATKEGAVFSQEQLDKDLRAVREMYGRLGYIKARTEVERTFAESEPTVKLRLDVQEGPKVYVNRVVIRGNPVTKDHVIRRDVTLIPGSVFTTTEIEESKRRLLNTGLFGGAALPPGEEAVRIRWADTDQPDKADAIVEVIEGGVGNVRFGVQVSSDTGLAANLTLSVTNFDALDFPRSWRQLFKRRAFVGGGQKLTVSLTPGEEYSDYRLSWLNPSVWDSPYSVGFDLYKHDFAWNEFYEESRQGAAVTVGRSFFNDLTVSLTPRIEHIEVNDVDDSAPVDAFEAKGGHDRYSLTLAAGYDRRDNVFLTTKGYALAFETEMAGTAFGGDINSMRETVQGRKWWTVWTQENKEKHTVNVGGEFSMLQDTGSREIPIFDRLFAGGVGSLRGFQYRGIGPVDKVHEKQIGGSYRWLASAEYEFPIARQYVRGVVFNDAGALSDSFSGLDEARAAAGIGLRLRIPVLNAQGAPISLFLSFPYATKSADKRETFSFTMLTGFSF